MQFSAFAPFGLSEFSGDEPMAEGIYRAISTAIGGGKAFDLAEGTDVEATNFADAIAIACARQALVRAKLNLDPATATEKIPQHEEAFVVTPPATATIPERRAVLAAKNLAARGSREEAITTALQTMLGTDFVALYVVPTGSLQRWPSSVGGAPGLYSRVDIPAKTLRTLDPIAPDFATSGVVTVPYENWDTTQADELLTVGDRVVVDCEAVALGEVVTVTAVAGSGTSRTFTATFTKAHPQGCSVTTRQTPLQLSTKRHYLVVLKVAAAKRLETRRKVNTLMQAVVRGVSTWSVVHEYVDGYGAFVAYQADVDALDANILSSFAR
jgi:hypothetical protein